MTVAEIIQGSDEWHQIRLGKVTASRVADVCAKTKSGYAASRANYMAQLVVERLTGQPAEMFVSSAMQWGTETEPDARDYYAMGADVAEVGFVDHPTIPMSGASPDGLVGEDGLIEIKAPNTSTHIDFLLGAKIPQKYVYQMQWQMACTQRVWCDFMSFDPRLPGKLQAHIVRVERDEETIQMLEKETVSFLQELEEKIEKLESI